MKVREFLKIYREDPIVQTIAEQLKPNEENHIRLKGLVGSLDAILAASIFQLNKQTMILVMHDKEEAAYFQNDLQNLEKRRLPALRVETES